MAYVKNYIMLKKFEVDTHSSFLSYKHNHEWLAFFRVCGCIFTEAALPLGVSQANLLWRGSLLFEIADSQTRYPGTSKQGTKAEHSPLVHPKKFEHFPLCLWRWMSLYPNGWWVWRTCNKTRITLDTFSCHCNTCVVANSEYFPLYAKENYSDKRDFAIGNVFTQGYFLLFESMLDTVLFARDKWIRPGGSGERIVSFEFASSTCTKFLRPSIHGWQGINAILQRAASFRVVRCCIMLCCAV